MTDPSALPPRDEAALAAGPDDDTESTDPYHPWRMVSPGPDCWTGDNPRPQPGPPYCPAGIGTELALQLQCELRPGDQHGNFHRATVSWPVDSGDSR